MNNLPSRLTSALAGRYRLEQKLGEGGMATVYLAEDIKHERRVALKILKPELAAVIGAERFLAEIKTTANLQHPHILPLFASGDADGFLFYVMPYVRGESLRARIDRERQLAVDEALRITKAVASALDYAHRQGVIHRDVKPENVLMHDGEPLVADFGIALAVTAAGAGRLTETGLSLGTPYYMSPEQATADRDPGPQSDVYSLACMLYEMLVGDPPHTGSSAQAVLAKILTERPRPVNELRQTVPPHVSAAVAKALERLPADRFDTAEAFLKALDDSGFTHASVLQSAVIPAAVATEATGRPARWRAALPWGVAAAAAAWALFATLGEEPAAAPVTRVYLTTPEGQEYSRSNIGPNASATALSPDGRQLVYVGSSPEAGSGTSHLWRRPLDELEATPIPGTEGARAPRFSKDGASLAFMVDDRLGVMPREGGTPVWLAVASVFYAWGDDGAIYFTDWDSAEGPHVLRWIPGTARAEPRAPLETRAAVFDVLPGSEALLIATPTEVQVMDLASGEQRTLTEGRNPYYLPSGHIVYMRMDDNALLVEAFDLGTLSTSSTAVSTSAVVRGIGGLRAEYAVAPDGTLVYATGGEAGGEELVWVDRSGGVEVIDWIEPRRFDGISLSPDGGRIAAGWSGGQETDGTDIWLFDLRERSRLRLTQDARSVRPQWHPTEGVITYQSVSEENERMAYSIAADGSGIPEEIVPFTGGPADAWWTRDGRDLLMRMPGVTTRGIFRFVPGEDDAPRPWLDRDFNERNPAPSPDGHWLVYSSDQSGRDEVYAQPYPEGGAVVPVSIDGGTAAVWSRDGREVFLVGSDGFMWSARVSYDASSFRVESRERLFEIGTLRTDPQRPAYDVASDGRFLFSRPTGDGGRSELVLVRNWVQEATGANLR
jgi:serine/threonine-protein kinase